jgi:hypothetical protein
MYVAMHFAAAAQVLLWVEFVVHSSQFAVGEVAQGGATIDN